MRTQKRLSTLVELCSIAIKKKMNSSVDPEREIILKTQCKKFNVNEAYIKKLIFANEEAIDMRYAKNKHKHKEKDKKLPN